jgi:Fic family protein
LSNVIGNIDEKIDEMASSITPLYTNPAAMEPLLPESSRPELAELTCEILRKSGQLSGQVPAPIVRKRIAQVVREMNSYYSNLIEGHKTLPRDIERALRQDYSANPAKRANQHLSRAHIEVEQLMTQRLEAEPQLSIHSMDFLCWLHREFYGRLPDDMHFSEDRQGKQYRIEPGVPRTFEVEVQNHQPPHYQALQRFTGRFESFYSSDQILATNQLIALAAAHHRMAWIHPFGDGNGRVVRLYSHAWLIRCKLDSFGLWTLSRGLARQRSDYYRALSNADSARWNDFDGRGNLSDRALGEFALFFLRVMPDQIDFMTDLLQLHNLCARIERYLQFEALHIDGKARERLARLLKAALIQGEVERGSVGTLVGLAGTSAREIIRLALAERLLDSPSPKGPLSLVFSAKTLESYFPQLYQDLPVEPTPAPQSKESK